MINIINQIFEKINPIPQRSEELSDKAYSSKVELFLIAVQHFSSKLSEFISKLNTFSIEVNEASTILSTSEQNTKSYHDETVIAKNIVVQKANDISNINEQIINQSSVLTNALTQAYQTIDAKTKNFTSLHDELKKLKNFNVVLHPSDYESNYDQANAILNLAKAQIISNLNITKTGSSNKVEFFSNSLKLGEIIVEDAQGFNSDGSFLLRTNDTNISGEVFVDEQGIHIKTKKKKTDNSYEEVEFLAGYQITKINDNLLYSRDTLDILKQDLGLANKVLSFYSINEANEKFATKQNLQDNQLEINNLLDNKANSNDVYNKTQIDEKLQAQPSLSGIRLETTGNTTKLITDYNSNQDIKFSVEGNTLYINTKGA